jgi:quercetin dioxygenase-like cupin family protein
MLLPGLLVFVTAFAQQNQAAPAASTNFVGKAGFVESKDLRVSRVRFEPGARTYWHVHTSAQILVAEEGKGRYQEQGNAIKDFAVGQVPYLKPNIAHWHGAAPDAPLVQATMYSGMLEWKGPVTDDEYSGKKK